MPTQVIVDKGQATEVRGIIAGSVKEAFGWYIVRLATKDEGYLVTESGEQKGKIVNLVVKIDRLTFLNTRQAQKEWAIAEDSVGG